MMQHQVLFAPVWKTSSRTTWSIVYLLNGTLRPSNLRRPRSREHGLHLLISGSIGPNCFTLITWAVRKALPCIPSLLSAASMATRSRKRLLSSSTPTRAWRLAVLSAQPTSKCEAQSLLTQSTLRTSICHLPLQESEARMTSLPRYRRRQSSSSLAPQLLSPLRHRRWRSHHQAILLLPILRFVVLHPLMNSPFILL